MRVLGHRGSRSPGPENTLRAVVAALAAGADGVEVDVRRCADGRLVLCHDPTVRGRAVLHTSYDDLAAIGVPLLADVLAVASGRGVVCEVKNASDEPDFDPTGEATVGRLLRLLAERPGSAAPATVSSFDPRVVAAARSGGLRTGLLTRPGVPVGTGLAAATAAGHPELHAHVTSVRLDRGAARRAHEAGVELVAWTVTRVGAARRFAAAGLDGVIADDPAAVVAGLLASDDDA